LTKWIPGWVSRGWKTSDGKPVLHQDLIKDVSERLSKFKSHRFVHVRAHTGGVDELSQNNDIVDRMARATIDTSVKVVHPPVVDDLFEGCPLRLLGPPVAQTEVMDWIRKNLDSLDSEVVNKHLFKAFTEICKTKDVVLTKQVVSKTPVLRAERAHLQIDRVVITKLE
jgi:ribonuclease HI